MRTTSPGVHLIHMYRAQVVLASNTPTFARGKGSTPALVGHRGRTKVGVPLKTVKTPLRSVIYGGFPIRKWWKFMVFEDFPLEQRDVQATFGSWVFRQAASRFCREPWHFLARSLQGENLNRIARSLEQLAMRRTSHSKADFEAC